MKLSFHGQSTIYFEGNGKKVIVDPFISENDKCDLDEQTLDVDYIILTHGHEDHIGGIPYLYEKIEKDTVIYGGKLTNALIKSKFENFGVKKALPKMVEVGSRSSR